ncbi:sortase B protein-sorting domain-containing protein, partial [[Ruminococcus] lactaris]
EKKPASTKPGTSDKSPQTGDTSSLALWIALLFTSGGAAIATTVVSRKKKYNR